MEKYKILGFMTIHYSGDYLREALLSVVDHVDKLVVAYSHKPSHGHSSNKPCPDTKDYILAIAEEVLGDKLIWDEADSYPAEAHHRNVRYKYSEGYDFILTVDADEVMIDIPQAIEYAANSKERYFGIDGYHNLFRSFNWACYDGFRPIRIESIRRNNQLQNLNCPMTIYHFSCAQRREVMEYKYSNFGHASEIKKNYLTDIFYKWSPENNISDLHPVSIGLWNAVPFNKNKLPIYMLAHPNFFKDIIE